MRVRSKLLRLLAASALATAVMIPVASASANSGDSGANAAVKRIFVIMLENHSQSTVIGNPNTPFINSLAADYGQATNYYGVTHPSQPNYVAAITGQLDPAHMNDIATNHFDYQNLVDQLESHGRTWAAYMDAMPSAGYTGAVGPNGVALYTNKHNPFVLMDDVLSSPARLANIKPYTDMAADLNSSHAPDFVWISPDQCNDMHGRGGGGSADPCDFSNEQLLIKAGDSFLANTVGEITSSRAWGPNSVIFVTWDESDFTGSPTDFGFGDTRGCCNANPGGGHVLTLTITASPHQPRASFVPFNHYSMLRTIEDSWRLGCLANTCDTQNVPAMTDLVGQGS
jgi:hypothetical protein